MVSSSTKPPEKVVSSSYHEPSRATSGTRSSEFHAVHGLVNTLEGKKGFEYNEDDEVNMMMAALLMSMEGKENEMSSRPSRRDIYPVAASPSTCLREETRPAIREPKKPLPTSFRFITRVTPLASSRSPVVLEVRVSHDQLDCLGTRVKGAFSNFNLCEAPMLPGTIRVRWRCRCWASLFDDYEVPTWIQENLKRSIPLEYTGMWELLNGLDRVIGGSGSQGLKLSQGAESLPPSSIKDALNRMIAGTSRVVKQAFSGFNGQNPDPRLPSHNRTNTQAGMPTNATRSTTTSVRLLTCISEQNWGTRLYQEPLSDIRCDRDLFVFLRNVYRKRRGRYYSAISMRKPTGIHFNEFSLLSSLYADLHAHESHCKEKCTCLPPGERVRSAEYEYTPVPPTCTPPIGPNTLLHFMNSPQCADEQQNWILNQFPKRMTGDLQAELDKEVLRWGIHFREGLNWTKIWGSVLVIPVLGSFLFGILWSVFKKDIQGAFGVASWLITLCSIVLG